MVFRSMRYIAKIDFWNCLKVFWKAFLSDRSDKTILIDSLSLGETKLVQIPLNFHDNWANATDQYFEVPWKALYKTVHKILAMSSY